MTPEQPLSNLLDALRAEPNKPLQWKAFTKKAAPRNRWSFEETLALVAAFAQKPLAAASGADPFEQIWLPGGPWREKDAES